MQRISSVWSPNYRGTTEGGVGQIVTNLLRREKMYRSRRTKGLVPTVFHCGPIVGQTGGISTVIEELTSGIWGHFRHYPVATWSSRDRDFGLLRTLRALFRLSTQRAFHGPFWVHVHVSERGSFIREGLIGHIMSSLGCRLAVTIHGADFVDGATDWSVLAARHLLKRADVVFCLGPVSQSLVRKLAPDTRCQILTNPLVPPAEIELRPHGKRPTTVIFGGELSHRKGFDLLKEAWPLVSRAAPETSCLVYGPASDVALDDIPPGMTYVGNASRSDLLDAMATAQIACLPSRREVLPMFILEAMARGLAIVTTSVGELGQLGEPQGVTRVDQDSIDLADTISRLARDPEWTEQLGKLSRDWVMANATTKHVIDNMEFAYKSAEGSL